MDCAEIKDRLLEAAEDELPQDERARLDEHLAHCRACRAEFEGLRRAADALRVAAVELAPPRPYLTPERFRRLMAAHEGAPKIFKLVTYRQFVAVAAAAAIIVSVAVIAWHVGQMRQVGEQDPFFVQAPASLPYVPVVLATTGRQGEPMNVVRSLPAGAEFGPLWDGSPSAVRLVGADSAGVLVPVDHVFYDPEESSRWW